MGKIIYFWSLYLRRRNRVIFKGDTNQRPKNDVYKDIRKLKMYITRVKIKENVSKLINMKVTVVPAII